MQKLLITLFLFLSASAAAQVLPSQPFATPYTTGWFRGFLMADTGIRAFTPLSDTAFGSRVAAGYKNGTTALVGGIPYLYYNKWVRMATGQLDSTIYASKYALDTTRTGADLRRYSFDTTCLTTATPMSLTSAVIKRNAVASAASLSISCATITNNGLGTSQHDSTGLVLVNNTAAAAGAQQISPGLRWRGYGWRTTSAASFAVDFQADVLPVQGSSAPTGNWQLRAKVGAGAYANKLTIRTDGLPITNETYGMTVNTLGHIRADGSNIGLYYSNQSNGYLNLTAAGMALSYHNTAKTATSGTENLAVLTYTVSPASGSYTHRGVLVNGTINQNASCTGLTYGLLVQNTLTNAIDWRSVQWDNNTHWGLYGLGTAKNYLGGNLLIKTTTDQASSLLTMVSTTQGYLQPVMTNAQMAAIASPATGLCIYNSDAKMTMQYNGTVWGSTGTLKGSYNSGAVVAQTTFTVTFGVTMPDATYVPHIEPTTATGALITQLGYYISNRTTTTFDVVTLTGITGTVKFDYTITQ